MTDSNPAERERIGPKSSPYDDANKAAIGALLDHLGGYQAVFNALSVAAKPNATGLGLSPMTFAHHLLVHHADAIKALSTPSVGVPVAWRWRHTSAAYGVDGAKPGPWCASDIEPAINPGERWRYEVQPLFTPPPALVVDRGAVAWRVKDFADGWILCHSEAQAKREAESAGNLVQALGVIVSQDPQADQCGSRGETPVGATAALAMDVALDGLSGLYSKTKDDWVLEVSHCLTEPTAPTAIIRAENDRDKHPIFRADCDTITDAVLNVARHAAVWLNGGPARDDCPFTSSFSTPPASTTLATGNEEVGAHAIDQALSDIQSLERNFGGFVLKGSAAQATEGVAE